MGGLSVGTFLLSCLLFQSREIPSQRRMARLVVRPRPAHTYKGNIYDHHPSGCRVAQQVRYQYAPPPYLY